jgi:hypothetical protein
MNESPEQKALILREFVPVIAAGWMALSSNDKKIREKNQKPFSLF